MGYWWQTLCTAALSLVHSTADYCAPVWCRSAHACLIDSVLNGALRIVTECLPPTPTDHLPIFSGIQPAERRRLGTTLSLAYDGSLDPVHILYGLFKGSSDARQEKLRSRRQFVLAARNQLNNRDGLGIRASEWTIYKWNAKYCENTSRLIVFIARSSPSARPVIGIGFSLPRTVWVNLNRLRTGERFHSSSMYKWALALLSNCECGAIKQTADHVLIACFIHRAPH